MGWPDGDVKAAGRYPNDILISGFDILFFWDARMMMQGLHFMGDVPFKTLYLHGLVRASDGQKMSKSKGNTVDPLGLIDQYGADALRFSSEERRVGKECVSTGRSRWSTSHKK